MPDNGWIQVHETEFYKNNLNPIFLPFSVNGASLNRNNPAMINKWEIWDFESDGKHRSIGSFYATINDVVKSTRQMATLDKKQKFGGNIIIDDLRVVETYPISDYLRIGLRLNLTVAIDFTGSNGVAKFKESLHYMDPTGYVFNQYQSAIRDVGAIVIDYDDDKQVPAFGFGAKLPGQKDTNFCFPINFNPQNPFVASYEGVLQAYQNCVMQLEFSGPTNFAPILNEAISVVSQSFQQNKLSYMVFMILTDGLITDLQQTISCIVKASFLPMSIIIIGVGNSDFSQMDVLDSDKQLLRDAKGQQAARDIVQFVSVQ